MPDTINANSHTCVWDAFKARQNHRRRHRLVVLDFVPTLLLILILVLLFLVGAIYQSKVNSQP